MRNVQDCKDRKRRIETKLNCAIQDGFIHFNVAAQSYDFPERTIYSEEHHVTWFTAFTGHDEFISQIDNLLFKKIAVLGLSLGLIKRDIWSRLGRD